MSERDPFLARWSRRKHEARAKAADLEDVKQPEEAAEPPAAVTLPQRQTAEPMVDPATLPPIDSIDAATDIRGFLARGVSPDLARAALRRAWVTDPAIRDFVGLADYDWDFNSPDPARGFGPLRPTDDVRQLLAKMVGEETHEPSPVPNDSPPVVETQEPSVVTGERNVGASQEHNGGPLPNHDDVAMQDIDGSAPDFSPPRRRHGSALPE